MTTSSLPPQDSPRIAWLHGADRPPCDYEHRTDYYRAVVRLDFPAGAVHLCRWCAGKLQYDLGLFMPPPNVREESL